MDKSIFLFLFEIKENHVDRFNDITLIKCVEILNEQSLCIIKMKR